MSHFYMIAAGGRGKKVTKTATKNKGFIVEVKGWNKGVVVTTEFDVATGKDIFKIYETDGGTSLNFGKFVVEIKE